MPPARYVPRQGLNPDAPDGRDFLYTDLFGSPSEASVEWGHDFNVFEHVGITPLTYDQGQSFSCVAQATAAHLRVWHKRLVGNDVDFSRKFIYAQIGSGFGGGASLREGVSLVASAGSCLESHLPSYERGQPPSEAYMFSRTEITPELMNEARPFDQFNYRVIPGQTTDIDIFAHAIRNQCGIVGGFVTTPAGWALPVVRPPLPGEAKTSHAVFLSGYGIYEGKKCLFTKNSWGDRYTITSGPWRGHQAIPEDYFLASENTAVGPVPGIYVFNAWVLVPDTHLTPNVQLMDFLRRNEGKLVQDVQQTGAFGIIINGKVHVARPERLTALLTTYLMRKEGIAMPRDMWNDAPKRDL